MDGLESTLAADQALADARSNPDGVVSAPTFSAVSSASSGRFGRVGRGLE
jgi:hypothetical protein